MTPCCLGIDTSNYTTSAAVCCGKTMDSRRMLLPVKPGEKGLRQSDAVFHHVRQLPQVLAPLLEQYSPAGAIGVSISPRSGADSYMPCFLVGKGFAQALGAAWGVEVDFFSHQQGHVAAALYSAGQLQLLDEPFLAFHVSGGTTEALFVKPDSEGMPQAELLAGSLDLKAGQAVDRVGVMLGMGFPCGPELERLALEWTSPVKVRPAMKGADCSLSGIENQCKAMLRQGREPAEIARTCIEAIGAALDKMCGTLLQEHGPLPVLFAGGVCSNTILRDKLSAKYGAWFATPEYSSDNGAGVAVLAQKRRYGL